MNAGSHSPFPRRSFQMNNFVLALSEQKQSSLRAPARGALPALLSVPVAAVAAQPCSVRHKDAWRALEEPFWGIFSTLICLAATRNCWETANVRCTQASAAFLTLSPRSAALEGKASQPRKPLPPSGWCLPGSASPLLSFPLLPLVFPCLLSLPVWAFFHFPCLLPFSSHLFLPLPINVHRTRSCWVLPVGNRKETSCSLVYLLAFLLHFYLCFISV